MHFRFFFKLHWSIVVTSKLSFLGVLFQLPIWDHVLLPSLCWRIIIINLAIVGKSTAPDFPAYFYLRISLDVAVSRFLRSTDHVTQVPLTRASRTILASWAKNPRTHGCPQMNWGRTLKMVLHIYDLLVILPNGTGFRLIEINCVLFEDLNYWAQQKHTCLFLTRHLGWTPIRHCTLISTKCYTEIPYEQLKYTKKGKIKILSDQPAWTIGRWRWIQLLLPTLSWKRPFLTAFSPETPPFSRACYSIKLVRSCGSCWT
jgi:hypothetical protein